MGSYGTGDSEFSNIEEITVDDEQNIYIVDGQNNSVKKFDQTGKFLLKFPGAIQVERQIDNAYPFGITYFKGKIYVTSTRNSIVRIYDKTGNYLNYLDIGTPAYAIKGKGDNLYIACPGYVLKTDEKGEIRERIGEGDFLSPVIVGLAINNNDEVIASDVYARKIFVFKRQ
jgi:DNA-binding beta-propeller fold protein YncE